MSISARGGADGRSPNATRARVSGTPVRLAGDTADMAHSTPALGGRYPFRRAGRLLAVALLAASIAMLAASVTMRGASEPSAAPDYAERGPYEVAVREISVPRPGATEAFDARLFVPLPPRSAAAGLAEGSAHLRLRPRLPLPGRALRVHARAPRVVGHHGRGSALGCRAAAQPRGLRRRSRGCARCGGGGRCGRRLGGPAGRCDRARGGRPLHGRWCRGAGGSHGPEHPHRGHAERRGHPAQRGGGRRDGRGSDAAGGRLGGPHHPRGRTSAADLRSRERARRSCGSSRAAGTADTSTRPISWVSSAAEPPSTRRRSAPLAEPP